MASRVFDINLTGGRCVEPKKRMVGGKFGYAAHRFPIIGGITFAEMMMEAVSPTETPFLLAMMDRRRNGRSPQ
jgi:hypothetical protein